MGLSNQKEVFLTLTILISAVSCFVYTKNGMKCALDHAGKEFCFADNRFQEEEDDHPMFYSSQSNEKELEHLYIWDPVKVGHERIVDVGGGNKVKMVTKSLKPKIFMIEDFLTDEEADYIVDKAKMYGLANSKLLPDNKVVFNLDLFSDIAEDSLHIWRSWDHNDDGEIVMDEIIKTAKDYVRLYFNSTNVEEMFAVLNMSNVLEDGIINKKEFVKIKTGLVGQYMTNLRRNHPIFRDRYSDQIWLKQSDRNDIIMTGLREKVIKLTNLPRYIIEGGEPLQVLNYQPYGHYHAHYDGQDFADYPNAPCCHLSLDKQPNNCMLCRLLTIIYYLNDVEEGGETAFPVADKKGFEERTFRQRQQGDLFNLSVFCHNAPLVVSPKKGRAILFYNHYLDKNGWMGPLDKQSLHGGCNIIKGEKWMANNWITAPPSKYADKESLYAFMTPEGVQ